MRAMSRASLSDRPFPPAGPSATRRCGGCARDPNRPDPWTPGHRAGRRRTVTQVPDAKTPRNQSLGAGYRPASFGWRVDGRTAVITLNRPEKKNPLTFESYAELRDTFERLRFEPDVRAVMLTGAGDNFCSGGDVHEIIGPLVEMREQGRMDQLLAFTRMTGDLVKAMRRCPQPIVAAVDGVCAGAGAILAMASDLRLGTPRSRVAFLFVKVGLSGADM